MRTRIYITASSVRSQVMLHVVDILCNFDSVYYNYVFDIYTALKMKFDGLEK